MSLTFAEAVVKITTEMPFLSESDVRGFFAATDEERALIIQSYKDSAKIPSADGWTIFLKICSACVEIANVVIPVTQAIQGIYGVGVLL